jgi:hypothetical protein
VSNPGERAVDAWVPFDSRAETLMAFDPMTGREGRLTVRSSGSAREVYLQIPAAGSLIVAESPSTPRDTFDTLRASGDPEALTGRWTVRFVKGGPTLPSQQVIDRLTSWTTFGHDAEIFSGTATYTTTFSRPATAAQAWQLGLGRVAESARVRLNGRDLATLIGPDYRVVLGPSQISDTNTLEISVTNLSANRIRDLDVRGVAWKKSYNVNFPARLAENRGSDGLFTASRWEPLDSGLLGPVTLTPLAIVQPK